jgi:hypothetical protein
MIKLRFLPLFAFPLFATPPPCRPGQRSQVFPLRGESWRARRIPVSATRFNTAFLAIATTYSSLGWASRNASTAGCAKPPSRRTRIRTPGRYSWMEPTNRCRICMRNLPPSGSSQLPGLVSPESSLQTHVGALRSIRNPTTIPPLRTHPVSPRDK